MVQSSREPGADPPASRFVVARVSSGHSIFTKGPAHLVERRAVAVVRPSVRSLQLLARLRRPCDGRAADRFSQREEVGVVAHDGSPSLSVGAFRARVSRRWRAGLGQAPYWLLPKPRLSELWAAELWVPRDTHADICVVPACAQRAQSYSPRRSEMALRGQRRGLSNPPSRRNKGPKRCAPSPDASIRPGSIASTAQSKRLPAPQNLGRSAAIRAACTRATAHSHHSHHCAVSHQSRLKRARRSGLFAATRQHCQFFCSARRWPPKRRP